MAQPVPAEGEVWVAFIVGEEGQVEEAKALSDVDGAFAKNAVAAAKQWVFKPGTIDGIPARLVVTVPVQFELQK